MGVLPAFETFLSGNLVERLHVTSLMRQIVVYFALIRASGK